MQRKGIGTAILNLIRNMTAHDAPDHYFLTVDALCINGYSTVGFYSKFGFQCVNWDTYSCRMFCTIIPDSDNIDG
ncbi:MAG: GNAT family N-acetyltransferase [Bacteroidaceae bacterium]|nr:GNAT family N-acetyltransferase [Bacteroidaceae bacterium]